MATAAHLARPAAARTRSAEFVFHTWTTGCLGAYIVAIVLVIAFDAAYAGIGGLVDAVRSGEYLFPMKLSFISATVTTAIATVMGVPAAYALSRYRLPGAQAIDVILDLPIVMPPLLMGVSLLVFFSPIHSPIGRFLHAHDIRVVYTVPAVIIAQFMVAAAFTVRCLKATFDSMTPRYEHVARTLGCTSGQAFWRVTLPLAKGGIAAGAIMTWARAIGEFGPIIVFAAAIEGQTEVLPTAIFMRMQVGEVEVAMAGTVLLILLATLALVIFKRLGGQGYIW